MSSKQPTFEEYLVQLTDARTVNERLFVEFRKTIRKVASKLKVKVAIPLPALGEGIHLTVRKGFFEYIDYRTTGGWGLYVGSLTFKEKYCSVQEKYIPLLSFRRLVELTSKELDEVFKALPTLVVAWKKAAAEKLGAEKKENFKFAASTKLITQMLEA